MIFSHIQDNTHMQIHKKNFWARSSKKKIDKDNKDVKYWRKILRYMGKQNGG